MPIKTESLADFGIRNITNYATEVNLDRAVPELYDGLKPVFRRVAWSAYHYKGSDAVKSAKVVGHCFVAGTKVTLSNGVEIPIEECVIGDEVLTDAGIFPVEKVFMNENCDVYRLTLDDGSTIEATPDHIFYCLDSQGKEFECKLIDLKPGYSIKALNLGSKKVATIQFLFAKATTYCIEVATRHRFYANGLLVHNCIGSYHPHGDAAVYGAMQTMVHHNVPLLEGIGNWGGLLDPAAAQRYTNVKLSKLGASVFEPDYLAVTDMVPNYDDTAKEPVVLPARLPFLVLNGADGIGVGITCSIPTFTAESVVEVLTELFSGKKLEPKDYARILKPKQHWGGHLVKSAANKKAWLQLMETGAAKVQFESTLEVDEARKMLTISEWPSGLSVDKFVQKVRAFPECQRCYNSKGATTFTIECKKAYNLPQFQAFVQKIQRLTQVNVSYRFNVTHRVSETKDGVTQYKTEFLSLSVPEFFVRWCRLRLQLEKRCLEYRIARQQGLIDYSKLLIFASQQLPVIFKALKSKDSAGYLVKNLDITLEQANQILDLKVRALSKLDQDALKVKLKEQVSVLKELQGQYKRPKAKLVAELPSLLAYISADRKAKVKRNDQKLSVH